MIDLYDLTTFIVGWQEKDYAFELGPFIGEVPHLIPAFDNAFNIEDMVGFVFMWNWYVSTPSGKILFREYADLGEYINMETTHEQLSIDIPVDAVAYEIQVNYEPGNLIITPPAENSEIQLTDINDKEGIFTYMSTLGETARVTLALQISGQNAAIQNPPGSLTEG